MEYPTKLSIFSNTHLCSLKNRFQSEAKKKDYLKGPSVYSTFNDLIGDIPEVKPKKDAVLTTTILGNAHIKTLSTCLENMYADIHLEKLLLILAKTLLAHIFCPGRLQKIQDEKKAKKDARDECDKIKIQNNQKRAARRKERVKALESGDDEIIKKMLKIDISKRTTSLFSQMLNHENIADLDSDESDNDDSDSESDNDDSDSEDEESVEGDSAVIALKPKEASQSRIKKLSQLTKRLVEWKKNIPTLTPSLVKEIALPTFPLNKPITDLEAAEVARLANLLRLYYPRLVRRDSQNVIASSIPFMNLFNWCCTVLDVPQRAKKVIPEPTLGKLWAIPLDKYTVYEILFNGEKGPLALKGITSLEIAKKNFESLFFSVFDQHQIAKACGNKKFANRYVN